MTLVDPVPPELADSSSGPSGPIRSTPTQRLRWLILALLLVGAIAIIVASLASTGGRPTESSATLLTPKFELLTHCGIDELQYQGYWYERVGGVLDDGSGNPPPGWANPAQLGRLSALDDKQPPERVVFTDDQDHREEFTLRPGATDSKSLCA